MSDAFLADTDDTIWL